MCSVVGYVGQNRGWEFVREALGRLECRGYDAAGFSCVDSSTKQLTSIHVAGALQNLIEKIDQARIDGSPSLGYTRWITRDCDVQPTAHSPVDVEWRVAVACSGTIENCYALRARMPSRAGEALQQIEAEIITYFLAQAIDQHQSLQKAIPELLSELKGAYAFIGVCQAYPDTLIAVRRGMPLCIGVENGEYFVASEPMAFAGRTERVIFLPVHSFALITAHGVALYDFQGMPITQRIEQVSGSWQGATKGDFESFMLKEMYEQKQAIYATVAFFKTLVARGKVLDSLGVDRACLKDLQSLCLFACGTSWHAASIGQFFFETIAGVQTQVRLASELRFMPFFAQQKALYIALSQSGETADVLEALRMINALDLPSIAITNVASSTLVREANGFLLTKAWPEMAVASTKSFSCQLVILYLLANYLAYERGKHVSLEDAYRDIYAAAQHMERAMEQYKHELETSLGVHYAQFDRFIFVGRHIMYPLAQEAALKLKEIAYIFAQGYPAGELKHGPIALIDERVPVVLFSHADPALYVKLIQHAQEIKAKGGHLVVFGLQGQHELAQLADLFFALPPTSPLLLPLVVTGVMQSFIYYIAKALGRPIDRPRNLAKSVMVE